MHCLSMEVFFVVFFVFSIFFFFFCFLFLLFFLLTFGCLKEKQQSSSFEKKVVQVLGTSTPTEAPISKAKEEENVVLSRDVRSMHLPFQFEGE